MKNEKDMIKWLNNLKSDIGQPQHSQLWHYAEILDVIAKYLESTDRTGEWLVYPLLDEGRWELACPECGDTFIRAVGYKPHFCENCGARMMGGDDNE